MIFIFCGCFTRNKNIIDKYSNKMYLDILEPIEFRKDTLGYMGCIPYGPKRAFTSPPQKVNNFPPNINHNKLI